MHPIELEIQRLLSIKEKINLYREAISWAEKVLNVSEDFEAEYPGLLEEFKAEFVGMCKTRLENLGALPKPQAPKAPAKPESPEKQIERAAEEAAGEPTDPLRFLLKYRHMDGKQVSVKTQNGEVTGTVRGIVAPNLTVELETGFVIQVPPKDLREV